MRKRPLSGPLKPKKRQKRTQKKTQLPLTRGGTKDNSDDNSSVADPGSATATSSSGSKGNSNSDSTLKVRGDGQQQQSKEGVPMEVDQLSKEELENQIKVYRARLEALSGSRRNHISGEPRTGVTNRRLPPAMGGKVTKRKLPPAGKDFGNLPDLEGTLLRLSEQGRCWDSMMRSLGFKKGAKLSEETPDSVLDKAVIAVEKLEPADEDKDSPAHCTRTVTENAATKTKQELHQLLENHIK